MNTSHCRLCGATLRTALLPGWGEEPVKHDCPAQLCHQCDAVGECQARTPCHALAEVGLDVHPNHREAP